MYMERRVSSSFTTSSLCVDDEKSTRSSVRWRSQGDGGFSDMLDQLLQPTSSLKNDILKRSSALYVDEIFRFYAAIIKWERLVQTEQSIIRRWMSRKKSETEVRRIVKVFVADEGHYANGCLSSNTKSDLMRLRDLKLKGGRCNPYFFEDAKEELCKDIHANPTLRSLVLVRHGEETSGIHERCS